MRSFPARPRLADHALARWHVAGGEELVLVHDTKTGGTVRLGAREWGLLAAADGTRDLEGIVLAASWSGAHARVPALRAFLEQLYMAGLLVDGAPDSDETASEGGDRAIALAGGDRAVAPLPDFTLRCDGRGSCCRLYASVVFAPVEAARARAHLPLVRGGGDDPARAFTPERGSGARGALAVALTDGRCAYLDAGGRCGIHGAADVEAKPLGCRLYPATFADDGETVRASVVLECACVLASDGLSDGEPIVAKEATRRRDLPSAAFIAEVPERIAITLHGDTDRSALRRWSRAVAAGPAQEDGVAAYWSLAADVERRGLAAGDPLLAPPNPRAILPWIEALARRTERRIAEDSAIRSDRDLARRASRWIGDAARRLCDEKALAAAITGPPGRSEALHLRATIHGHHLVGDLPIAAALRDRAVRLLVARAMPAVIARAMEDDPAGAHPLALVEAMLRGHGLDAYAHDVA